MRHALSGVTRAERTQEVLSRAPRSTSMKRDKVLPAGCERARRWC
jgi:hypothetical protein